MNETTDIRKLDIIPLKALLYDLIMQQQQVVSDINVVQGILQEKLKETK